MTPEQINQAREVEARLRKNKYVSDDVYIVNCKSADTIAALITALESKMGRVEELIGVADALSQTVEELRVERDAAQADAEAKFVKAADRHNLMVVKTAVGYVLMDKGTITAQGAKP